MNNAIKITGLYKRYKRGLSANYFTLRETLASVVRTNIKSSGMINNSEFWALENINLNIKKGEVLGIIGPNGAGKSTLLKILTKITYPTKGRVVLNGKVGSLLEVGTGFHQELTGRENIYLNGAVLGMTKSEINKKFDQIVKFSGVKEFLDTPVKRYSSGMQIRLAFSVAAHLNPEILLVDEVLSVGDVEFQKKCLGKMEEISHESQRTILFVSHNLSAIRKLCTRTIYLKKGKVVADGDTQKVIDKYLSSVSKSSDNLIERKDRVGSGTVLLKRFSLMDDRRRKVKAFVAGNDSYVKLDLKKRISKINSIDIILQIVDGEGSKICTLGNKLSGDKLDVNRNTFVCKLPRLPLTKGDYYTNVIIKVDEEVSDSLTNAFSFKVISENYFETSLLYKNYGKVFVDHSWE